MNIFVAKLHPETTGEQLRALFEQYGNVTSSKVIFDHDTGNSKGFGFVEMDVDNEGQSAVDALNGTEDPGGNQMVVKVARPQQEYQAERQNGRQFGGSGGYQNNRGYDRRPPQRNAPQGGYQNDRDNYNRNGGGGYDGNRDRGFNDRYDNRGGGYNRDRGGYQNDRGGGFDNRDNRPYNNNRYDNRGGGDYNFSNRERGGFQNDQGRNNNFRDRGDRNNRFDNRNRGGGFDRRRNEDDGLYRFEEMFD